MRRSCGDCNATLVGFRRIKTLKAGPVGGGGLLNPTGVATVKFVMGNEIMPLA